MGNERVESVNQFETANADVNATKARAKALILWYTKKPFLAPIIFYIDPHCHTR